MLKCSEIRENRAPVLDRAWKHHNPLGSTLDVSNEPILAQVKEMLAIIMTCKPTLSISRHFPSFLVISASVIILSISWGQRRNGNFLADHGVVLVVRVVRISIYQ